MVAVLGAALVILAGCGGGTPGAQPSASPSVDARAAWIEAAKCMRANGAADFPDPVQNDQGDWNIPHTPNLPPVPPACVDLVRRAKQATRDTTAPTAEEMAKLRDHAKCMREHGVPNHPDPDEDGNFGVPEQMENDPAFRPAYEACKQYLPPVRPK
jgi:hypothetical protein